MTQRDYCDTTEDQCEYCWSLSFFNPASHMALFWLPGWETEHLFWGLFEDFSFFLYKTFDRSTDLIWHMPGMTEDTTFSNADHMCRTKLDSLEFSIRDTRVAQWKNVFQLSVRSSNPVVTSILQCIRHVSIARSFAAFHAMGLEGTQAYHCAAEVSLNL